MKYVLKFIFLLVGLFIIYHVVVFGIMDNKQPNGEIIECQYKDPCPEGALIKIFSD